MNIFIYIWLRIREWFVQRKKKGRVDSKWETLIVDGIHLQIQYKGVYHTEKGNWNIFWKGFPTGYNSTNSPLEIVEDKMKDLMPEFVDFDVECVVKLKRRRW